MEHTDPLTNHTFSYQEENCNNAALYSLEKRSQPARHPNRLCETRKKTRTPSVNPAKTGKTQSHANSLICKLLRPNYDNTQGGANSTTRMRKTKSQQSNLPHYYYHRAGAPQTGALPRLIAIVYMLEVPQQGYPLNNSPPTKSRKESQQGCSKKKAPSNSKLTTTTIKSKSTHTGVQPQEKANQPQC